MRLGNAEVWIECNQSALPEYSTDLVSQRTPGGPQTAACYVPSQVGMTFAVNCRSWREEGRGDLVASIEIDGAKAGEKFIEAPKITYRIDGIRVSSNMKQRFQFSKVALVDNDELMHRETQNIGTIKVSFWHVLVTGSKERNLVPAKKFDAVGDIHERSKKVGIHCVSLGSNEPLGSNFKRSKPKFQKTDKQPQAVLVFRYRPLNFLQAQGIAPPELPSQPNAHPRTSPVESTSRNASRLARDSPDEDRDTKRRKIDASIANDMEDVKPDVNGLSRSDGEELRALKVDLRKILDRIDALEQRQAASATSSQTSAKRESQPQSLPPRSSSQANAEVIDLTLDE